MDRQRKIDFAMGSISCGLAVAVVAVVPNLVGAIFGLMNVGVAAMSFRSFFRR